MEVTLTGETFISEGYMQLIQNYRDLVIMLILTNGSIILQISNIASFCHNIECPSSGQNGNVKSIENLKKLALMECVEICCCF